MEKTLNDPMSAADMPIPMSSRPAKAMENPSAVLNRKIPRAHSRGTSATINPGRKRSRAQPRGICTAAKA